MADGLYLAGYPLLALGALALIRGRTPGRDRAGLLDASIVSTGMGLLARYGGEEFAALLLGCSAAEAFTTVERLRGITPLGQTFSAGIAVWDGREDPGRLVHRADVALYEAKRGGRDRVVSATPGLAAGGQPRSIPADRRT